MKSMTFRVVLNSHESFVHLWARRYRLPLPRSIDDFPLDLVIREMSGCERLRGKVGAPMTDGSGVMKDVAIPSNDEARNEHY
ncbi:hypothetical protein V6N13_010088 [Hibiscus sabdariffa]